MARRIQQNSPLLGRRLYLGQPGAQGQHRFLRRVEVVHGEIEVHLLRWLTGWPLRRAMIVDSVHGEQDPCTIQRDEVIGFEDFLKARKVTVEVTENAWNVAVQRNRHETRHRCHVSAPFNRSARCHSVFYGEACTPAGGLTGALSSAISVLVGSPAATRPPKRSPQRRGERSEARPKGGGAYDRICRRQGAGSHIYRDERPRSDAWLSPPHVG
jgi:hypothetical protein